MPHDMPQRPKQHRREDLSKRVWEMILPETWTYAPSGQREYGIDGQVEIFDGDSATGLVFNVQLKGVDKPSATKAIIKTSTRNYWKKIDSPTLVVLVDASETVHFAWAHQFDVFGRKKNAASYGFDLPSTWDEHSAAEIEREARAARAAGHLRSNLPIYWTLGADASVPAAWVGGLKASLERGLSAHRELTRRADQAGWATLEIQVDSNAVSVRLRGTPGGFMHYNRPVGSFSTDAMAADVLLGLAIEVERGGLDILGLALIEAAIPASLMLGIDADLTDYVAGRIAEAGNADAALALIERVAFDETAPLHEFVLISLIREPGRFSRSAIMRIAERIAEHASDLVVDGLASSFLYNAGNMIARWDPQRGVELYEMAAERFPAYRRRSYWWRERGSMSFDVGNFETAVESYEQAIKLRDTTAIPLLADSYCAMGLFSSAVETWDKMGNVDRYLWILKMWAVQQICTELELDEQQRDTIAAEALLAADAPGLLVMRADALNPGGLWRAALERRDSGTEGYATLYIAAACFARVEPILWFEALISVQSEEADPEQLTRFCSLIILTAVQETGDAFRQFVLEDEFVRDDARDELLALIDTAPELERPFVIRSDGKQIN